MNLESVLKSMLLSLSNFCSEYWEYLHHIIILLLEIFGPSERKHGF